MSCNDNMRTIRRFRSVSRVLGLVASVALMTSSFSGCGAHYAPPTVYPVKGQVLLADGKPLTNGQVVLVTKDDREFPGKIESDGHFSINTPAGDGAPEGEYQVRIDAEPRSGNSARSTRSTTNLPFPAKYASEVTSDLVVTVKPTENTLEPFKLVPGSAAAKPTHGKGPGKRD